MSMLRPMAIIALCVSIAGCAAQAVKDQDLETRTAVAIGQPKGSFVISDRADEGYKTSYSVKTKGGQVYGCYVTGGIGLTGANVSDAICNKKGEPAKNPLLGR